MTPQQAAKWQAFRVIQPAAADRICEILKYGFAAVANAMGAKYEPDDFEETPDKRKPKPIAGAAQVAAIARAAGGVVNVHGDR